MPISKPISVLIADDHELFRKGLRILLTHEDDIELLGEAKDGVELFKKAVELKPDIVVTDIHMPLSDGIETTIKLRKKLPHTEVIGLSFFADSRLIKAMIDAGAKGYLEKSVEPTELLLAVRAVANKQNYFCKTTMAVLTEENQAEKDKLNGPHLTKKEIEIIKLICEEHTSIEIAGKLNLSPRTVETHRERILHKIRATNIAGLVVYAMQNDIYKGRKVSC